MSVGFDLLAPTASASRSESTTMHETDIVPMSPVTSTSFARARTHIRTLALTHARTLAHTDCCTLALAHTLTHALLRSYNHAAPLCRKHPFAPSECPSRYWRTHT
eukprot:5445701-Pleurochrysis_carterae.AAC.5